MKQITFIDIFSGCGGMSLGFEMAGFEGLLAIDNWQDALDTYVHNRPGVHTFCGDLSTLNPAKLKEEEGIKDVDVIIGGPPCQGFSIAGKRIIDDERNILYKSFVRFVAIFRPKAFVMENVPNILSMGQGLIKEAIIAEFSELGYKVENKVLSASDYGVPQNRKRAFFVGLLSGQSFNFPKHTVEVPITSMEALSDLNEGSVIDGSRYSVPPQSTYQMKMREGSRGIFNHQITQHAQKTIDTITLVPDGGNYKDLPLTLQDTRRVNIAWTRLNSQRPSFTIDTGHRHHFHYKFNRVPTVRECARIQSFPDDFVFCKSKTSQYKQVGNAVPPLMAKAIAECLIKQL